MLSTILVSLLTLVPIEIDAAPTAPESAPGTARVGLHMGVNLGVVALDVHAGRFYGLLSASLGVPLVSNGAAGAFTALAGVALPLGDEKTSGWTVDLFALANPGWISSAFVLGAGVGVGIRFVAESGFTFAARLPVFGVAFGASLMPYGRFDGGSSLGYFFASSAMSLPIVSFGYTF